MNLEDECNYIWQHYGRYECDATTSQTCMEILHWMEVREEQDYGKILGKKGKEELRERLFKDQEIRHRRKTLDRCLDLLLKDIYICQSGETFES